MKKVIMISCDTGHNLAIEWMQEFQGDLKDLTDDAYEKLKKEIIEQGYSFAIHIWKEGQNHWILDGHQRVRTIRHMCEFEGWSCPELPVVYVKAKSFKDAKLKLLAATSNYGDITKQGLYEYMEGAKITFPEVDSRFKFDTIKLSRFNEEFYLDTPTPAAEIEETKETKEVTFTKFKCPECGHQFFEGEKQHVADSAKSKTIRRKKGKIST